VAVVLVAAVVPRERAADSRRRRVLALPRVRVPVAAALGRVAVRWLVRGLAGVRLVVDLGPVALQAQVRGPALLAVE
jgi:hypothetical protein